MDAQAHHKKIAKELGVTTQQVAAVVTLLDEDGTVPFIARYRKEHTGSLDEVAITTIRDRISQLKDLDKRRAAILKSLDERELLTDELKEQVLAADTLAQIEDVYLPYRPKRRTRATAAREKGLEPLAQSIFEQDDTDPMAAAESYINTEKGVETVEEALAGARDIIAEWINEDQQARAAMRLMFEKEAIVRSKVIKDMEAQGAKYRDYFEWEEPIATAPSHRVLAIRRGENEKILSLSIAPSQDKATTILEKQFVKGATPAAEQVKLAVEDSYHRLLSLSMETEIRTLSKHRADAEATRVFAENLRELLLMSPLGSRRIMALDPGFKTGCKMVCLDDQGALLHTETIFPHTGAKKKEHAEATIRTLCEQYKIEAIAVGNGTGGRETEKFIRSLQVAGNPVVVLVNESGASVYSASETARKEFPDQDITVRGSVSIGRRLMDPLAELVKIDPKSIGVGQYQHDVDQGDLKKSLDDVVMSCVNKVGVEINTASAQLLSYVAGLNQTLAGNIIGYREEHGPFSSRQDLLNVPRLGPKAYEQAAGFLRIRKAEHPLDASGVHPERYGVVDKMADDQRCTVKELMEDASCRKNIILNKYVSESVGLPTLTDILEELARPGRDPREEFEVVEFAEGINKIEEVKAGMQLTGVVTNVTNFGAFVDVGVHHDGLVHISQLADRYVKHAGDVVKVGQKVQVKVIEVDLDRKRIALSMKSEESQGKEQKNGEQKTGPIKKDRPMDAEGSSGGEQKKRNRKRDRGKKAGSSGKRAPSKQATVHDLFKVYRKI